MTPNYQLKISKLKWMLVSCLSGKCKCRDIVFTSQNGLYVCAFTLYSGIKANAIAVSVIELKTKVLEDFTITDSGPSPC